MREESGRRLGTLGRTVRHPVLWVAPSILRGLRRRCRVLQVVLSLSLSLRLCVSILLSLSLPLSFPLLHRSSLAIDTSCKEFRGKTRVLGRNVALPNPS